MKTQKYPRPSLLIRTLRGHGIAENVTVEPCSVLRLDPSGRLAQIVTRHGLKNWVAVTELASSPARLGEKLAPIFGEMLRDESRLVTYDRPDALPSETFPGRWAALAPA